MAAKKKAAPKERKPAKPTRPVKETAAKRPAVDEAADKPGMPLEAALALCTALLLVVAIGLVFYEMGTHYGAGPFKGSYSAAP